MKQLIRSAQERSTFGFAVPVILVLGWLVLSGLFIAAISRPAALDASINKILAQRKFEPEPSLDATATAAVSADRERREHKTH